MGEEAVLRHRAVPCATSTCALVCLYMMLTAELL